MQEAGRILRDVGVEQERRSIGADSLGYISEEGMVESTGQSADDLCTACFTGRYPMALPDADELGKHLLEATLAGGEA